MEVAVTIPLGEIGLEALWHESTSQRACVVAHPHPQYGGSMHNNVVEAVASAYAKAGWSTLRFNFRGVGRSTGTYGQGEGEQDDLAAAVSFVVSHGAQRPAVVGYSFGAWVAAFAWHRLRDLGAVPLVLIAPPVAAMSFVGMNRDTEVALIICGEHDEIAPPRLARELGLSLDRPVDPVVIAGADHFFVGDEEAVGGILGEQIEKGVIRKGSI